MTSLCFMLSFCLLAPLGAPDHSAASFAQQEETSVRWQAQIRSPQEFNRLARTYYQGRFYALPHLMFVIDRAESGRIYYVNSQRYAFHQDFVNANYLTLERGREFYQRNYLEGDRRFILGTIVYQLRVEKFTFEFWEGDLITADLLREAYARIRESFFAPVYFKPNSPHQEAVARQLAEVPRVLAAEVNLAQDYLPLNQAQSVGRLRILDRMELDTIIDRNEIVIFRQQPITLTPLSGLITTTFSTPLAHVNLLAKGWGIPNAYIKGADELFKHLEGKFVYFETRQNEFILRPADTHETAEYGRRLAALSDRLTPLACLSYRQLTELKDQRRKDSVRFGAKAANLGELIHAVRSGLVRGIIVPPGFSIPFFYYEQFLRENRLDEEIVRMLSDERFNHDPAYRKRRLAELRARIQQGRLNPQFRHAVWLRTQALFGRKGVFVRSSTNSEDLPHFSGAGLYTSVPNVRGKQRLLAAIKTVWASLWNYEAYEARESAGINHAAVYPAVLIQQAINADAAGVMITTNPFDREESESIYLNAKRGLGIRVVEGNQVPEQIIYRPQTGHLLVLTRSGDDTMLKFNRHGGVRPVKIETQRAVLTDEMVRKLASAAAQIKRVFGGCDQDIEWLTVRGRIYIVQSRPYVEP